MARASRWWKCDLQVATPDGGFKAGGSYDFSDPQDRAEFARTYMEHLKAVGIEVVALAAHNSVKWVDEMIQAGHDAGIVVFPGVELTTGSGVDGVHLVIIGGRERTAADLDRLLYGAFGFADDHPTHDPLTGQPAPTPRSLIDILSELPADYLVIAPHALNDNGIASKQVQKSALRWKALHHDRLSAIDVGDPRTAPGDAWNAKFRARDLDHFPCLDRLAFVATSDAYALDELGRRYTWIRMSEPSLEALRQAFLDYDARIICDWDDRVVSSDPNSPKHSFVSSLTISGPSNSEEDVTIEFDPHLNVVIGGRGSGKSTIVAALRQLYGDTASLPPAIADEAARFVRSVFASATLRATHVLATSHEEQEAWWMLADGSKTSRGEVVTPTEFAVRVINQKELFERVLVTPADPCAASRNLLTMVDDSLGIAASDERVGRFATELRQAQERWIASARERLLATEEVEQRGAVDARIAELRRQLDALDSASARDRRARNEALLSQRDAIESRSRKLREVLDAIDDEATRSLAPPEAAQSVELASVATNDEYFAHHARLEAIAAGASESFHAIVERGRIALDAELTAREAGAWAEAVRGAEVDAAAYRAELMAQGISPENYDAIRQSLAEQEGLLQRLKEEESKLPALGAAEELAWTTIAGLHDDRRQQRNELLSRVQDRSGLLRFRFRYRQDVHAWVAVARDLIGLRVDGFVDDMFHLARWLWHEDPVEHESRHAAWRSGLLSGDLSVVKASAALKTPFVNRLETIDETVRARLAAELADDVVDFYFLQNGGDPNNDAHWQPVIEGSPGQRGAAMLSFVLHHGDEPLVLDQPEDDLDTDWISHLVVQELRRSRWSRQLIVITHNANIPVNGDADRVVVMENIAGKIRLRKTGATVHSGPIEDRHVRHDIQDIMEGGVSAFVSRERKYNNELSNFRAAMAAMSSVAVPDE